MLFRGWRRTNSGTEESLEALRRVVRRKLNLSETTAIQLAQVRGTTKVDLEDGNGSSTSGFWGCSSHIDDDFDAFRSLAVATGSVNVQITYDAPILSEVWLYPTAHWRCSDIYRIFFFPDQSR